MRWSPVKLNERQVTGDAQVVLSGRLWVLAAGPASETNIRFARTDAQKLPGGNQPFRLFCMLGCERPLLGDSGTTAYKRDSAKADPDGSEPAFNTIAPKSLGG